MPLQRLEESHYAKAFRDGKCLSHGWLFDLLNVEEGCAAYDESSMEEGEKNTRRRDRRHEC